MGILAAVFLMALTIWGADEAQHVSMRVRMVSEEFVVGEPVAFVLEFDNPEDDKAAVYLGGDGIGTVCIELSNGAESRMCFPPIRGGASVILRIVPRPGSPVRQGVFLNDFNVERLEPGEYEMTVAVEDDPWMGAIAPPKGTRWERPRPAKGAFRVVDASEANRPGLEKRLERWMEAAQADNDSVWRRGMARKAILLSRHPAAWAVQEAWFRNYEWRGDDEFQYLVESLLDSGRDGVLQNMVVEILKNPQASVSERMILCYALQRHGALEWKDDRAAFLAPWTNEIRRASPLTISD